MLPESMMLPGQAVVPLGVALAHLVLGLYVIYRRGFNDALVRFFIYYALVAMLWNVNLTAIGAAAVPFPLPGFSWLKLAAYGLLILGLAYWVFARIFLQLSWKVWWGWLVGLVGLALMVSLDTKLLQLPAEVSTWSNGRLNAENAGFIPGTIWGGLFMGLVLLTAINQQAGAQNPAHRNRIQYLLIATLLLLIGYGMYLSLREPFWTTGLIVTWLGSALTSYIVVVEDLPDLSTGARQTINILVVTLVTVAIYVGGIYLVQIFLGDFIASTFLTRFLTPPLLIATVTAVLLTIVYTPIQRASQRLTNRILFGRSYNYQAAIQEYTPKISNILYLDELVSVALNHIKQTLGLNEGILFMLDSETAEYLQFRILPALATNRFPQALSLTKETPIIHRLAAQKQSLAQYTIDISPQFKEIPEQDRQILKSLNLEWFIPVLKQEKLIGVFALGTKRSKQRYTAKDIRLLATLADQTALALENANLVDQLQRNLKETTRVKNLMNNVFDSMDTGVITTDLEGRITLFNKAAQSILHLPPAKDCIGRPYTQALPSLTDTIYPNLVTNVLERENRYADYEIITNLPERGKVNLSLNLAPLKDAENQTRGVTVVIDDVTETKRLQAVQDMFRRYVSPAVVDRLPADASELELGGHRQVITVLFADIRGFTAFSEKLAPEKLVDTLNEYLSMAASSILMYEGTLDKFMGDAAMGIFNAPLEQKDHVLRAVRAALAMQRAIIDYHNTMGQERPLSFGVGLHVGEAVVGNVGMSDRMDYTAIGDTVNLAKRIQENTPGGKALVSEAVYQVIKDSVPAVFYKEMKVKGREQPVNTYELQLT